MTKKTEEKPQLVRQDADLLNPIVSTWTYKGEIMEFMGVKRTRTFETMDHPDYERGVGFRKQEVWIPRPGPMKVFDKDGLLIEEGTVDFVKAKDDIGSWNLTYVGKMTRYDYDKKGKLLWRTESEFSPKDSHIKWHKRYDKEGQLVSESTYDKYGKERSFKFFKSDSGELSFRTFNSKSGKGYYFFGEEKADKNHPEAQRLIRDNIASKKTDKKARRAALKEILAARQEGQTEKAQEIRHEFDKKPLPKPSLWGKLTTLVKGNRR